MYPSSTSSSDGRRDGLISAGDQLPRAFWSRTASLLAMGCFAVVLFGTLVVDVVAPVTPPRVYGHEAEREARLRTEARFSDGTLATLIERDLRKKSRVRRVVMDRWAGLLYRYLRWTKPPVVCGPDGWLFVEDRILAGGSNPDREIRWTGAVLAALERRFTALGHEILIMPVPRKASMVPQHLPKGYDARPELDDRLMSELLRRKLNVVDIRADLFRLGDDACHMLGSHWTDEAQLAAARAVAARLGAPPRGPEVQFRSSAASRFGIDTDLLKMAGVLGSNQVPPEAARKSIQTFIGTRRLDWQDGPEKPGPVALLGTSFSVDPRCFRRYLTALLGVDVWNGSRGGVASGEVLTDFEALGAFSPVVIMEAPLPQFLSDAHSHFGNETFTRRAPKSILRLRSAKRTELKAPLGEEFTLAKARAVFDIPAGRLAHTGDGVVGIRLKGTISTKTYVFFKSFGLGRLRYIWRPGVHSIVIPFLDLGPAGRRTRISLGPEGSSPVSIKLDAVELVLEVAPQPVVELAGEKIEAEARGWKAVIPIRDSRILGSDAVLLLRLDVKGGDFDGRIVIKAFPGDTGEGRVIEYRGVKPKAVLVSSLRALAGRRLDRIEIRGRGGAPGKILNRSNIRLGRQINPNNAGGVMH